eukprot:TRINITY_DN97819_c0_g1_i1.p1 TRINITY_DN97819_c0_g1~~TRINITY_DN97819_c0_g1_i1.p1  ORF type:complete len:481 (-),score=83.80 TRINITY_DN97819_c0_g1_i1:80-1522(-)
MANTTLTGCYLPEQAATRSWMSRCCACVRQRNQDREYVQLRIEAAILKIVPEDSNGTGALHNEAGAVPTQLQIANILGAAVIASEFQLRIVHCPVAKAGRYRDDFVMQLAPERLAEAQAWAEKLTAHCCTKPGPGRFLVLINPFSGSGSAAACWEKAKQLWADLPWMQYDEVFTERAGEATERAAAVDLATCSGIVVVSGDGMIHEVFNGLSRHRDARAALQIPVGHLPGGTGNGLAKTILDAAEETFGTLDMAFLIAKGGKGPVHLCTATVQGDTPRISFLSLTSGIFADIDIASESLRACGSLRNLLYAPVALMKMRSLKADLVYWPNEASASASELQRLRGPPPELDQPLPDGPWKTVTDEFTAFIAINMAWASHDALIHPDARLEDETWALVLLRRASRVATLKFLLGLETGSQVQQEGVEVLWARAFRLTPHDENGFFYMALDGENVPAAPAQVWPAGNGMLLGIKESEVSERVI